MSSMRLHWVHARLQQHNLASKNSSAEWHEIMSSPGSRRVQKLRWMRSIVSKGVTKRLKPRVTTDELLVCLMYGNLAEWSTHPAKPASQTQSTFFAFGRLGWALQDVEV
jgi:hypothetical protein